MHEKIITPPMQRRLQVHDESLLIERAKRYDQKAISELYKRHVQNIYRYIYYRVGDVNVAEDLTADVFLRALEGLAGFTYRGVPFSAWLYRIAHARVMDHFRQQARRELLPLDERLVATGKGPQATVEARLDCEELQSAIAQLTTDQQQVIILKFVEGLSNAEAARILGKTEGAVKALQHRALNSLQRTMRREE
jgi:RNA polymerase sigma-70 factor (ECF subfamily)